MLTKHKPASKDITIRKNRALSRACAAGLSKMASSFNVESLEQRTLLAAVPSPWAEIDIGDAANNAQVTDYTASPENFHVSGSGSDIWDANDSFHFVYQTLPAGTDTIFTAQVSNLTAPNGWTKAGLIVRAGLDAYSQEAMILDTRDNGVAFQGHPSSGTNVGQFNTQANHDSTQPVWLRLVRAGDNITGYYSTDGSTYTQLGTTSNVPFYSDLYIGLAVTSHDATQVASADFSNLSMASVPAPSATTGLVVTPDANGYTQHLSWTPNPYADSYNILRSTTKGSGYQSIGTSKTATFDDYPTSDGSTYYYVVQGVNTAGTGANSNEAHVTPGAPIVTGVATSTSGVTLTWAAGQNVSTYSVGRGTSADGPFTEIKSGLDTNTLTYADTTGTPGTVYYYVVTNHPYFGNDMVSLPVVGQRAMTGTGTGIRGTYYSNRNLTAPATFTRIDAAVDNDFGNGGPTGAGAPADFPTDNFSVRWTGQVQAETSEPYTFTVTADDGQRLYIDGQLVIDNWVDQGTTARSFTTPLWTAGDKHTITYEYYENGGGAQAHLHWSTPSMADQAVPATQLYERAVDGAPTITGTVANNGAVRLSWSEVDNATSYNIYRSDAVDGTYTLVKSTSSFIPLTYTDTGLNNDQTYYYKISAVNSVGEGAQSTAVPATPALVVTDPPVATAKGTDFKAITISWAAVPFADTYSVYRSSTAGGTYSLVAGGVAGTSVKDDNLTPGSTYYYVVTTTNQAGESARSTEVSAVVGQGLTGHYYSGIAANTEPFVPSPLVAPGAVNFAPGLNYTGQGWAPSIIPANPADGNNQNNFSVRWTGQVYAPTDGTYSFIGNSDDAGYVFVDGTLVSWDPIGHGARDADASDTSAAGGNRYLAQGTKGGIQSVYLTAGYHNIVVDYGQGGGGYSMTLKWIAPGGAREVIPQANFLPTMTTPAAPTGLTYSDTGFSVDVYFTDASTSELGFKLQRMADGSNTWKTVNVVDKQNLTQISDYNPLMGQHVKYRVVPFNYEGDGTPSAVMDVTQSTAAVTGLAGRYWSQGGNEPNIAGTPRVVRVDSQLNFDSGAAQWSPTGSNNNGNMENFSVAWTGQVYAPVAGQYTFITQTDDAAYLWVDDQRVSFDPGGHGMDMADSDATKGRGGGVTPITLTAGWHNVFMTYAQGGGGSGARIYWTTPAGVNQDGSAITRQVITTTYLKPHEATPGQAGTFTATPADKAVTLNWTDDTNHATVYWTVERATKADFSDATTIATLNVGTTTYTDTGLTSGTPYYYRLTASNFDDVGTASTLSTTTTILLPPNAASNLTALHLAGGKARLAWTDNSLNEDHFIVQRRDVTASGTFETVATLNPNVTSWIDSGLTDTHVYEYQVLSANVAGNSDPTPVASITAIGTNMVAPWQQQDIGGVAGGGAGNIDASGNFALLATGADIWGGSDAFHYVYQPFSGDGMITIHVTNLHATNDWTKAGVMFRNDLGTGAVFMGAFNTGTQGVHLQGRSTAGDGNTTVDAANGANAAYLRITRLGNVFTAFASDDGINYRQVGAAQTMANMGANIYVGLALTGHTNDATNPASFEADGVTVTHITTPPPVTANALAVSPTDIRLAWTDGPFETGYNIDRATQADFSDAFTLTTLQANSTYYVDHYLNPGTKYYYRIVPTNGAGGDTANAAKVNATTLQTANPLTYNGNYDPTGWTLSGTAAASGDGGALLLTNTTNQRGWAFGSNALDLTRFKISFDLYTPTGTGDGMTLAFVKDISANALNAGGGGGALAYGGIANSAAIKFDLYNNIDKTGLYYDGVGVDGDGGEDLRPSNIDLNAGHLIHVDVSYAGSNLTQTVTDLTTGGTWTKTYTGVDLAKHLGGTTGYVGFTAATGGAAATQEVVDFGFQTLTATPKTISGTSNADTIVVKSDGDNTLVWVNKDPATQAADYTLAAASVGPITIDAGGGDDTIIIDSTGTGDPLVGTGLTIVPGAGNDTLRIVGGAADDIVAADAGSLRVNSHAIAGASDVENLQLALGGGTNRVTSTGGTYTLTSDLGANGSTVNLVTSGTGVLNFKASQHINNLTLSGTSKVAFDDSFSRVLVVNNLIMKDTSVVDLNNNDLVLKYTANVGVDVAQPGDPVVGLTLGTDGNIHVAGYNNDPTTPTNDFNAPPAEDWTHAIDGNTQKYLIFGDPTAPGANTGFYVTPSMGSTVVTGIRIFTANDAPERDPLSYVLVGTNDDPSSSSATWTQISAGDLAPSATRNAAGAAIDPLTQTNQTITFSNTAAYKSYRVLFPTLKGPNANSMQVAEVQLLATPEQMVQTYVNNWVLNKTGPKIMASHASVAGFSQSGRSLAVFDNHDAHFSPFDGETFTDYNQVIAKYTYLGDANGDGKVDPTDYAVVDGKIGLGHSWITGDLNFDGKVDPSDYAQIDGNQGAGQGGDGGPRLVVNVTPAPGRDASTGSSQLASLGGSTSDTGSSDSAAPAAVAPLAAPASSPFSSTPISGGNDLFGGDVNVLA